MRDRENRSVAKPGDLMGKSLRRETGRSGDAGNGEVEPLTRREYDHQFENLGQRAQRAAGGTESVSANADTVLRYDAARCRADGWSLALATAEGANRAQAG